MGTGLPVGRPDPKTLVGTAILIPRRVMGWGREFVLGLGTGKGEVKSAPTRHIAIPIARSHYVGA